jgi:hypothetical protein
MTSLLLIGATVTLGREPAAAGARCSSLIHVGDSTTVGMARPLADAYRASGFVPLIDGLNGRGVTFGTGGASGLAAGRSLRTRVPLAAGNPCWVVDLGLNDAAYSATERWQRTDVVAMMQLAGSDPVLWVNIWMWNSGKRPMYSTAAARRWDTNLARTLRAYPNARVLDWASTSAAHPDWFLSDHIHYTGFGYQHRAAFVAAAASAVFARTPSP